MSGQIAILAEDSLFFGETLPLQARLLMQQAIDRYDNTEMAEASITRALEMVPDSLELHIARYKFFFYKNRLQEAEQAAQQTLATAADQGGFSPDWEGLTADDADWRSVNGPERVYLFTLKALSFIALRRGDPDRCTRLLGKLAELDPDDQVGGSVIAELRQRVCDEQ